jgi:hypothetical protein
MNNLIELSRTSDSIYNCVVLPKDAHNIEKTEFGNISFDVNQISGLLPFETIDMDCLSFELLGTLDTLTEEQAREIVEAEDQMIIIEPLVLETLKNLIESKGVNTKENVTPIIKVKL